MSSEWTRSDLKTSPDRIRPETHWFQETRPHERVDNDAQGRVDGNLWFSLQFNVAGNEARARQLYQSLGKLFDAGARMPPASHKALKYTLDLGKLDTIGTDIYVPKTAFPALEELSNTDAFQITDAGLAVEGEVTDCPEFKVFSWDADEPAKSIPSADPLPAQSPVIIAIIDDGIGIANHRFRQTATTTRVKHFLDLAVIGMPAPEIGDWANELLGRSWKAGEIDNLLQQDETQVYRALGLIDPDSRLRQPLRAAVTHGSHTLDLAAGYDWRTEKAKAASRPIIAVQLPTQVAANRSDTWLPQSLKRALDWILVKADELSDKLSPECDPKTKLKKRLPLIVNGSFASMAGPQDGCGDVERRITQFVKTYRGDGPEDLCTFVLSVGNALQLRAVAEMDIASGRVGEIPWRVLPDDKTPSFVQIWLPEVKGHPGQPQVKISLVPPRDAPTNEQPVVEWKIGEDSAARLDAAVEWKIGEDVVARIYHQRIPRSDGSRECITIAIRPTVDDRGGPVVPSGLWLIKIENNTQQDLRGIDLRVHRDDVGMFARTGARQSYFDHPEYERFDPGSGRTINDEQRDDTRRDYELSKRGHWMRVTRQGTLSTYVFAEGVLAVGGYRRSDGQPAEYSSSGREGARAPDVAAVSERSPSESGIIAAGTCSGSVAILNGTSVAAPQVTRALADLIEKRRAVEECEAEPAREEQETAVAVDELKATISTEEQRTAVTAEGPRTAAAASAASQQSRLGRGHFKPHLRLRDGVGRLSFKSSYPKRIGD